MEKRINCTCGKLVAMERDGHIFIKCRSCKHEHEIPISHVCKREPRANEPRADRV